MGFRKAAGQGVGKQTTSCIAKEAPFIIDIPLGLVGKAKPTLGCIAREVPFGPSLVSKGYGDSTPGNGVPLVTELSAKTWEGYELKEAFLKVSVKGACVRKE